MTWTVRPDWIVVTGTFTYNGVNYHAAGDGVTDDTAAIQAALNVGTTLTGTTSMNGKIIASKAVYLPAGIYKITSTLHWRNFWGGYLVGCGCNTTIQWYGAGGASMFWADGAAWARFVGITWDGRNIASCAYQHMNNNSFYAGRCRHENEAFKNFSVNGTYMQGMVLPAAGIISGISDIVTGTNRYAVASGTSMTPGVLAMNVGTLVSGTGASPITGPVLSGTLALRSGTSVMSGIAVTSGTVTSGTGTLNLVTSSTGTVVSGTVVVQLPIELGNTNAPTAEMMVTNCLFQSCSNGIIIGYNAGNEYQWLIDGCEFESCGTGIDIPSGIIHVSDCHFQNSSVQDIWEAAGHASEIRRCTSQNSVQFFNSAGGGSMTPDIVEDCWIDHWTGNSGAIALCSYGPYMIFDCTFTNPVNTTKPAIFLINSNIHYVTLSGNYCSNPNVSMINTGATASIVNIPCGARSGNVSSLSSGSTVFLSATTPFIGDGSTNVPILNVTGTNFAGGAKGTGKYYGGIWYGDDDHDAIQAAINQAKTNNNGSIVYLPTIAWYGNNLYGYRINSCLQVSGSNYIIEQGGPNSSYVMWGGTGAGSLALTGTMMAVSSPQNILLKRLNFLTGESTFLGGTGAQIGYPPQTGLYVSSTTSCSLAMEDFTLGNASGYYQGGNGLVLAGLPAGSLIYLERLNSPLVVRDCGQAEIFAKHALPGTLVIRAPGSANNSKTGFLGFMVEQQGLGTSGSSDWSMKIDDNQDLVIGSYYNDGDANHLLLSRGIASGSTTGRVTIQGDKDGRAVAGSGYTPTLLEMDNYAGRVMYGSQAFPYGIATSPVIHTGTNALDFIFGNDVWGNYLPTITESGTGLNLIQFQNVLTITSTSGNSTQWPTNLLPTGYGASVAQGFDHLLQMGLEDLKLRYGIENLVSNGSVEADPANPAPTSTIGYTPTGWTVTSATACGSGVRNFTVAGGSLGGSPFGSGSAQSMLWVDTTGTNVGSTITVAQTFTPAAAGDGAVLTFDFRLNTSGTQNDFWIRTGTPAAWTSSVHIANSGTAGSLSAIVSGSDQKLCSLNGGTWYRVRVMILAPGCGQSNATLQIAQWTSTGPGTMAAYTVDGVPSIQTSGFSQICMTSGGVSGQSQSMNLDNIALVCNDPLLNAPEQAWKSQNFPSQALADPGTSSDLANPSGDGMSNLMKYAMNLNPMLADSAGVTSGSSAVVGGTAYIYLTHRVNLAASDICFGYEQSTDLLHWNPATPEVVNTVQLDQFTDALTVRIPSTGGSANRLFMRLKITKP